MKVFQVEGDWSRDNVRLGERPDPEPGSGQVRLRMTASALNYRDLLVPQKGYGSRMQDLPLILLCDGVGVVDAVGEGVSGVSVGERMCPLFFQTWLNGGEPDEERLALSLGIETDGTMANYMVLDAAGAYPAPAHLTDEEAATLPCAAVTAWRALVTEGRVKAGDTVLVQGTGGVSLFALQFAKMQGCHVIATSSSNEKLEQARGLGADETINYREIPDWGKRAREIVGGGVDHIVEVGGQGTLPQSLRAVRTGGTISMIGVLSGGVMDARLGMVVTRHVRMQGITVGSRDDFAAMARAIEENGMRPVIDRTFAFEELLEAMDYLASGQHFGKICIRH